MRGRVRNIILAVLSVFAVGAIAAPIALAGPTFSVMNAEGGIFWRSAPDWNAAERINGFGVYNGEIIEPHCYESGAGNVPGTSDHMWEYASDVNGPGFGTGWVNEHFINDGQPINQPSPGVPPCNAPPPPPPAPGVATGAPSAVSQTEALLNASVDPNGSAVTDCHFDYGSSEAYGASVPCASNPGSGGSPVAVSAAIGSLAPNRTYHFRIVASNGGGTSYGGDVAVTTLPEPPTVSSAPATGVTQTSAELNGTVNPNEGSVSSCTIEYGLTTEYGASAPCTPEPGDGDAPVAVSADATGLSPDTVYHYRIVAQNPGGTTYGADQRITTLGPPDFGRCEPANTTTSGGKLTYEGGFTSSKCTKPSATHDGKYEWVPGAARAGVSVALKSGTITLASAAGLKITCTGASGSGELLETKEVIGLVLDFSGCAELTHPCTSEGASEGTIATSDLLGTLGWDDQPAGKAGIDLAPAVPSEPVASFRCVGSAPITVTGSVIAPLPASKMASALSLKFSASKGIQKPSSLEGAPEDVLNASLNGEASERIGLTASLSLVSEEPLEVNTAA